MLTRSLYPLFLLVFLGACQRESPEAAFDAFYKALRRGDVDGTWLGFSEQTQKKLEDYLAANSPPGVEKKSARARLLDEKLVRASRQIVRVEPLTQSAGKAVLEVTDDIGEKQQVRMVFENKAWRVDIDLPSPGV
jgi:hypothetical protein